MHNFATKILHYPIPMSLTIDLLKVNELSQVILNDSNNDIQGIRLINNSSYLSENQWFKNLKRFDEKKLLDKLTEDQLIASVYFFIRESVTSVMLMKQWFLDLELTDSLSEELADFLYEAKIESLNQENFDEISDYAEMSVDSPSISIAELIQLLREKKEITWLYTYSGSNGLVKNDLRSSQKVEINVLKSPEKVEINIHRSSEKVEINILTSPEKVEINMTQLKESSFMIEDHHCIVIGLSSSFTSFVEVIMHSFPATIASFCSLIRVSDRDMTTVGNLLLSNPLFLHYLSKYFKRIEFCGFNDSGQLVVWDTVNRDNCGSGLWYNKLEKEDHVNGQSVIPLFMKLVK